MPVDPAGLPSRDPQERLLERLAALEREVRSLTALVNGGAAGQIPVVQTLPAAGRAGRLVFLASDGKVYKDTGAAWANPV